MTVLKLGRGDFENFSVVTTPVRYFRSSSIDGITGSISIYPRRSKTEKNSSTLDSFRDSSVQDDSAIDGLLFDVQQLGQQALTNKSHPKLWGERFSSKLEHYMTSVNQLAISTKKFKKLGIKRFTPTTSFTYRTLTKLNVKDVLNPYYRVSRPSAQWAYTNYNSINFFTASQVPTGSALLYPMRDALTRHDGHVEGSYVPSGSFSFDFYINPRYRSLEREGVGTGSMIPGTIMQVPGVFALSMIPGTARDNKGNVSAFTLMLQLERSTGVNPTQAYELSSKSYPNDLIFLSNMNVLEWNNWHHVVVRWGTNLINGGTGSFNVDGLDVGKFVVPSGTIAPILPDLTWKSPAMLCVGNFFESGSNSIDAHHFTFFGEDVALRDGIANLDNVINYNEPVGYKFRHPLRAEMHDVSIKRYYMTDDDIIASSSRGPLQLDTNIAFYLPPFFVQDSPFRKFVGTHGGILQTPFFEVDGTTDDPFNVAMSFGVNGHYMNIENFVRDFASDNFPRLHLLTGSAIDYTTDAQEANKFLYNDPLVRKRNLTILPCDDGEFIPSFELLEAETRNTKYRNDLDVEDSSLINLNKLLNESALLFGSEQSKLSDEQIGFTPERPGIRPGSAFTKYIRTVDDLVASGTYDPGVQGGAPLTIYNRTRDASSNQVTFFDVSNLFYGDRILPGSFKVRDSSLSGSGGNIKVTLRDNGYGSLYRADSVTSSSTWSSVGNIYYDEGIIVVKDPSLYFFGKEGYEMWFKGERKVHVSTVTVNAGRNEFNSSSNPNWASVPASTSPTDTEKDFVYITGINIHDENMNVVMKTQLAQPIMKRYRDKISFRVKYDW
jgi:hypothetical protein